MTAISMQITGIDAVIRNITRKGRAIKEATVLGLEKEAHDILLVSQTQFVPIDTGELMRSGVVVGPNQAADGHHVWFNIRYGVGGAQPYALAVHEHPSEHSPPSWHGKTVNFTVGGPKYLEIPLRLAGKGLIGRLLPYAQKGLRAP